MTNYTRRALGKAILDMGSTPIASTTQTAYCLAQCAALFYAKFGLTARKIGTF